MTSRPKRDQAKGKVRTKIRGTVFEPNELNTIKSIFGVDNAKQMGVEQTVRYFVPQDNFYRLFAKKNQILLGSRGSGKTTWVRMLAHDHVYLAARENSARADYARAALAKNLIGIYVPASAAFAGDLKNKSWQSEAEAEEYFVWRLNLHVCSALTHIINTCVLQYKKENENADGITASICKELSRAWSAGENISSNVSELRLLLSAMELKHQTELRRRRTSSKPVPQYIDHFDNDLLLPFKNSINIIKAEISIPSDAVWMICLDEIEYLSELHHRILNSQIRASSADLVFKVATMPFAHHTLATNLGDPVREGNDFEYINVDQESIDSRGGMAEGEFLKFARAMFARRIAVESSRLSSLTLKSLLGSSPLIDSKRVETPEEKEAFMRLLKRHANPATLARAEKLRDTPKFRNEIVRKMHGALLLRDALQVAHGNTRLRVYCGESMVVRCCDGNARRLMRVINLLVQQIELSPTGMPILPVDAAVQTKILETVARDTLSRVQSEPPNGAAVAVYLREIGEYFQRQFSSSSRKLGTDQVTSIEVTLSDGEAAQKFIKQAVQLSLMLPSKEVTATASDQNCAGVFHLAFLFAPLFKILPRRNSSVRLSKVLSNNSVDHHSDNYFQPSLI